jgi:chromosome segregation ATPase
MSIDAVLNDPDAPEPMVRSSLRQVLEQLGGVELELELRQRELEQLQEKIAALTARREEARLRVRALAGRLTQRLTVAEQPKPDTPLH